ncbi:hypothetical protein SDC9_179133 [bioreactor metagenome]|uniref:Uncharacterized protein n=1 Tax=bioreactor metagenome TaxID=1076179 RepID=A0A645H100_9ZZZZ
MVDEPAAQVGDGLVRNPLTRDRRQIVGDSLERKGCQQQQRYLPLCRTVAGNHALVHQGLEQGGQSRLERSRRQHGQHRQADHGTVRPQRRQQAQIERERRLHSRARMRSISMLCQRPARNSAFSASSS